MDKEVFNYFAIAELYYMQNLASVRESVSQIEQILTSNQINKLPYSNQVSTIANAIKFHMTSNGKSNDKKYAALLIRWYSAAIIKVMNMSSSRSEEVFEDIFRTVFCKCQ